MPEDTPSTEPPAKRARVADDDGLVTPAVLEARLEETTLYAKIPEGGLSGFICTHHGTFHADEAMACAMLKCLPEYVEMPILRTRNQAEIDKAAVVVDVGATYEPEKHRYDHHQRSFTATYSEKYAGIKLSSAGLVFRHFGAAVVRALCGPLDAKASEAILAKTYDSLVRELDAQDNGVQVADEPRYRFCTHLGARIGRLNPSWREPSSPDIENARFKLAMKLAAKEFCDVVCGYCNGWLPARTIVEEALSKRREVHPSGEVMKLPRFCPWQEHLFDLEEEAQASGSSEGPLTKYVVFQDSRAGWRVQAVPKARGSFENRLSLPKAWCGVRDQQLSDLSGIQGCVFVHAAGFIGGNESEAGALEMASKALAIAAQESAPAA
uniref:MYG1 protein n=1 Tax=Alexandrium monilatum TaxID=311494 RepID=A0A7S4QRM3_9DINO|mmetsp:Transcript_64846/g.193239  ORF Transcript_64846/g.193239 Transcript_64846/m.193239 type:complete len:381 (-) Transcript_64846:67-1209(-)|eukprot:CAMPEP_0175208262 /NCGR_PEP_ID=MMETSP0093-20121207/13534_1 /TAXON_ID=311494 /ORGANISM="Alexandrium monilatum, Strain CCMP3105" /LENGTH=380 /DNA_ID=CAMNT_0016501445 /DNA_START=53 /DNA_END=1195 /DNA_ORIENTATION=+